MRGQHVVNSDRVCQVSEGIFKLIFANADSVKLVPMFFYVDAFERTLFQIDQ